MGQEPDKNLKQLYGASSDEVNWLATAGALTDFEAEIAAARLSVRRLLEAGKDASAAALRVARLLELQNRVKNNQADDLLDNEFDD